MIKKTFSLVLLTFALAFSFYNIALGKEKEDVIPEKKSINEFQVKTYPKSSNITVMKAVLNILQDDFFFISQADSQLGFIVATKDFDTRDKFIDIQKEFGCSKKMAAIKRYSVSRTEANINVTTLQDNTEIKVNFRKKILNMYDVEIRVRNIEDKEIYDEFFKKIETELKECSKL